MFKFILSLAFTIITLVFVAYFIMSNDIMEGITHLGYMVNGAANQND